MKETPISKHREQMVRVGRHWPKGQYRPDPKTNIVCALEGGNSVRRWHVDPSGLRRAWRFCFVLTTWRVTCVLIAECLQSLRSLLSVLRPRLPSNRQTLTPV